MLARTAAVTSAAVRSKAPMLARMMGTTAGKSTVIDGVEFRNPVVADAKHMWRLVVNSTLDTNSAYAYMAFCAHFAEECIVAYEGDKMLGFVKGYRPPTDPSVIFVWQVGVDDAARGKGIAGKMIHTLAKSLSDKGVRYIEATVTPNNTASRNLFKSLARRMNTNCDISKFFAASDFPEMDPPHEEEELFRVGPFHLSNE